MTTRRRARIYRPTARNLAFLAGRLRAGELVAVPSETVYGLAGDALSATACRRIFAAKRRPASDPLIVHIHSLHQLPLICIPNPSVYTLARRFWPGPLTLVLPKTAAVPDVATAGKDSVAVRMPRHADFRRLLKLAGCPLAAPSANPFGYISPTSAAHVLDHLGSRIRYILNGGAARIGLESTILDLREPENPVLLRPGAISLAELSSALGRRIEHLRAVAEKNDLVAQVAPGLLARHYSPRTPVVLHDRLGQPSSANEAFVYFRKPAGKTGANVFWLDSQGDLRGVARRLFATLRDLDARGFRRIHIEKATGGGLADAINDRLRRAATR